MSEDLYETTASAIALAIWEISTGNGHDLGHDDWDCHMQNCHAAVANAYVDDISIDDWHRIALDLI
jgi:hypothetical protein